ncbi:sigma-70 family RNA polymerase sigma factor [Kribbella deserti]|uniref:Sigma-70 family RNA polymerase sigma factor n=1 Tax=Kribbella deserti TaxID=1926257 RepID=A0ABV6QMY8_9ACTN
MSPLDQLWRLHADDVRRFLLRRVRSAEDADDLLQEVFLRAVRTPPEQPGPAWLYTVARRVLIDHYRRASQRREVAVPAVPDGVGQFDASIEDDQAGERAASCAAGMLGSLPDDQANALRIVDMDASTHQAAALSAGVSVSGMKSRVQRGRTKLRTLVEGCCHVERDARGAVLEIAPCPGECSCACKESGRDGAHDPHTAPA